MLKTLSLRAHQKGLELLFDVAPDVPEFLHGDSFRLRQVLVNLIGNAIKFTQRGEINLSIFNAGDDRLTFAVRDTGMGIPRSKLCSIFESFTQADGSTTRHFGGTGLGLAISSQLVNLMDGRLQVDSEPGKGSTFYFTAHIATRLQQVEEAPADPIELAGLTALIVDDNPANRQILERLLRESAIVPTSVGGGREALAELRRAVEAGHAYDLVLVDAMMPELDGFDTVDRIRDDPTLAAATIMMLSSGDRGQEVARCRRLGISTYLVKPIQHAELLAALLRAVASGQRSGARLRPTQPPISARGSEGLHILLAEDNEVNRTLTLKLLRKRGHYVVSVENGKEAVDATRRQTFDIILMDIQMPEMDGIEATRIIRACEQDSGTRVPIVALTAHAMEGDKETFLAVGMDEFIAKPLRVERLVETIDELLTAARPTASFRVRRAYNLV